MTTKRLIATLGGLSLILMIGLVSCSDDTVEIVTSSGGVNNPSNSVTVYFPILENYTTVYEVTNQNSSSHLNRFKVGREVSFLDSKAWEWFSYDEQGRVDTGFLQVKSSSIDYYESANSDPERILQYPLTVGSSWQINDALATDIKGDGFAEILIEEIKAEPDTSGIIDKGSNKNIPIVGSATMTVVEINEVQLKSGKIYFTSYHVTNQVSATKTNHFWFVPGIGLVKYVLNSTEASYPSGEVVGELISYGQSPY